MASIGSFKKVGNEFQGIPTRRAVFPGVSVS